VIITKQLIKNKIGHLFQNKAMIRHICLLAAFVLFSQQGFTQDIYNYQHSKKYGQYLFESKQYSLAAEELERVLFYNSDNDSIKFQLIRSYLLDNQFAMVTKRMDSLFPKPAVMPRNYALEYSKALVSLSSIYQANKFMNASLYLTDNDKHYLDLNIELLDYKWDAAQQTYKEIKDRNIPLDNQYDGLFTRINTTRYKSPGLALALSAVVPGMGKVYTHNWKDGLFSFIFVGGTAFQAIRGYKEYGKRSGFFIAYTSLAATFYLGNLYGSFKAANKFNDKLRKQIHSEIRSVFNATL